MGAIKWIKRLVAVVSSHDADLRAAHARIDALEKLVRERTDIGADIGYGHDGYVILVGRYKGADYVQSIQVSRPDFEGVVSQFRELKRAGIVRFVDAPPAFRAVIKRDL